MVVTHQYDGLIVGSTFIKHSIQCCCQGVIHILTVIGSRRVARKCRTGRVARWATTIRWSRYTIFFVCYLITLVAQIEGCGKISRNFNVRHTVRHDIVAALGEDETCVVVDVLGSTVAVGHVVVLKRFLTSG